MTPSVYFPRAVYLSVLSLVLALSSVSGLRAQSNGFLVITEINYHPTDANSDLEFIEIHNATSSGIDLSEWFFSSGISFQFPQGTWLNAWDYLVICANEERVREVYGIRNTIGDWASCDGGSGGCALANEGEAIEISERNGVPAVRVRYDDRKKWSSAADGAGHTLELRSTYEDQNDADNWVASSALGGSPGEENPTPVDPAIVINEGLYLTEGETWVELYNTGATELDISGFYVSNERENLAKSRLPAETTIGGRSHLVLSSADVGFDLELVGEEGSARAFFALSQPGEEDGTVERVVAAHLFEPEVVEMSEARIPDGVLNFSDRAVPTPGEPNRQDVEDGIVINEIMYQPIDLDSNKEFVELYNRSDREIDMTGWSLTRGFNFDFPAGTRMAPGAYIVLARDPQYIQDTYGLPAGVVFGPDPGDENALDDFGRLRNDGERITLRDANRNVVDTVRYHDGGEWPDWTDGDGSSIELIDPMQDNEFASAWDASDDSAKSEVETHVYEGSFMTGAGNEEFHVLLNSRGMAMVDDMKLVQREIGFESQHDYIAVGDTWKIFKGTQEPSDPVTAWRQPDFDDAAWIEGASPIGFGEDDEATVLDDMEDNYLTFFLRKEFDVSDVNEFESLVFQMEYDDGFAAYLNGERIAWENLRRDDNDEPQTGFDIRARAAREKVQTIIDLEKFKHLFVQGRNVLAVQVHNSTISSGDARGIPQISGGRYVVTDGPNAIINGDFEEDLRLGGSVGAWFVQGTHVRSGRTTANPISGTASLKLVASAKGDNKVNRLEQTLARGLARTNYAIEFKSRWIIGSPTMLTHGHNLASAAFDYPSSHRFKIPANLGSPGAANSVTLREVERSGGSNIGPVMTGLTQSSPIPAPNEEVVLRLRVSDSGGIGEVKLYYWIEDRLGRPGRAETQEVPMFPDGTGHYFAAIPGQENRARVVFYIEATDKQGNVGRFPVDRLKRSHPLLLDPENPQDRDIGFIVYRHDVVEREDLRFPSYRFFMNAAEERHLSTQRTQSNDRHEGTFVFRNSKVYYGSRTRFSGSPWARGGLGGSYRVYMPKDKPFRGSPYVKKFNMEDHQNGARSVYERLSHYMIGQHAGQVKSPYAFQWMAQWRMLDRINTQREHVQAPNKQFIDYWFPEDEGGHMFEVDDRFEISDGGTRAGSVDARWTYPPMRSGDGANKENYRFFFNTRLNKGHDDYSELIEGARFLDLTRTPNAMFDEEIFERFNVEQMMRVWSIRMNTDDWDTWGTDRGKNCYIYWSPTNRKWHLFAWDMELTYGNSSRFMPPAINGTYNSINGGKFPEVVRMINRPRVKRVFYRVMAEMVKKQFRSAGLAQFRVAAQRSGMSNMGPVNANGFIDQRNTRLRQILRSATLPALELQVRTNGGDDFTSKTPVVTLQGRAPVEMAQILAVSDGNPSEEPIDVAFSGTDPLGWTSDVPLAEGVNNVDFLGFSSTGDLLGSTRISVTFEAEVPQIDEITPAEVAVGDWIDIRATNLHAGLKVFFGDTRATEVRVSGLPEVLSARVPDGVAQGESTVVLETAQGKRFERRRRHDRRRVEHVHPR